jgi:hypothetical protein
MFTIHNINHYLLTILLQHLFKYSSEAHKYNENYGDEIKASYGKMNSPLSCKMLKYICRDEVSFKFGPVTI